MAADKKKVLIVEDIAVQAMLMKKIVEKCGHQVIAVVDQGEKAITVQENESPHLILMDIFLNGDMNGIDAMHAIRKKSGVPVIYVSANSDPYYVHSAKQTNYADFIFKPLKKSDLSAAIDHVFKDERQPAENAPSTFKRWVWPF